MSIPNPHPCAPPLPALIVLGHGLFVLAIIGGVLVVALLVLGATAHGWLGRQRVRLWPTAITVGVIAAAALVLGLLFTTTC